MNIENRKILWVIANYLGWSAWFLVMDINIWHMREWSIPYGSTIGITLLAAYCYGLWNGLLAGSGRTSMWQWWRESKRARKEAVK